MRKSINYFSILIILLMMQFNVHGEKYGKIATKYYLYVGAYAQAEDEGIYIYEFDAINGDLTYKSTMKGVENPSYLAIDQKRKLLAAVNETEEYKGEKSGSVSSFRIDETNGQLQKVNQVSSGGGAPCYISLNKSGTYAFIANYSGGNISVIPISSNGELNGYTELIQHSSSGLDSEESKKPHAHAIVLDPKEKFVIAADLGIDKILSYGFDEKTGLMNLQQEFLTAQGAGPRHLTFHQNKKLFFFINELNSTITSCTYNSSDGSLSKVVTVSTLPEGYAEESYCADIHVSPDGNYLYGSNRGHNSIVVYKIDQKSGNLSYVEHHSVKGEWPRNFMIDPTGKFLLVANQHTNNIVVFKIDQETGKLKSNGVEVKVNKPVCLKMMEKQ